jgi:HEAT repeat protein
LGKLGDIKAVPYLVEALQNDESRHVRFQAIIGLDKMDYTAGVPEEVIAALVHALKDPYRLNRLLVARVLVTIGQPAVPFLREVKGDPELRVTVEDILAEVEEASKQ